jgi:hypothetical protein
MTTISEADSRAMVRLLGDTAALDGGHAKKKQFLMKGLCTLIAADAWVWTLGTRTGPGEPQAYAGFLHGGFDEERFAKLLIAIEHPAMAEVAAPFFEAIETIRPATMLRHEIDPKRLASADGVRECWENADIGPLMMTGHPLDEKALSAAAFYRKLHDEPFSEREKQITHIIFTEVPWLHATGWPDDRGVTVPKIFPRQRLVLNLLLDGLDRKRIATHMGITENTVAGYAKDVYLHFDVHSQPELMRKFFTETPFDGQP